VKLKIHSTYTVSPGSFIPRKLGRKTLVSLGSQTAALIDTPHVYVAPHHPSNQVMGVCFCS
jgi:hypothetical protein